MAMSNNQRVAYIDLILVVEFDAVAPPSSVQGWRSSKTPSPEVVNCVIPSNYRYIRYIYPIGSM